MDEGILCPKCKKPVVFCGEKISVAEMRAQYDKNSKPPKPNEQPQPEGGKFLECIDCETIYYCPYNPMSLNPHTAEMEIFRQTPQTTIQAIVAQKEVINV